MSPWHLRLGVEQDADAHGLVGEEERAVHGVQGARAVLVEHHRRDVPLTRTLFHTHTHMHRVVRVCTAEATLLNTIFEYDEHWVLLLGAYEYYSHYTVLEL